MTHTKKTLGHNWTRYHNYYGMNRILEAACTKRLHWDWEALHDYTIKHAPEVNYENAMRYAKNPPPLPDNDDDAWFQSHPKLPGSSKAPRKQPQPQTTKTKKKGKKAQGGGKKLPASQQGTKNPVDTGWAQWPYERSSAIRNQPSCSSGSCRFNDW